MSNGMKIFIAIAVFIILWKNPGILTQILHAVIQALNAPPNP